MSMPSELDIEIHRALCELCAHGEYFTAVLPEDVVAKFFCTFQMHRVQHGILIRLY